MQIKSKALTHFNKKEFEKAKELYLKICKKSPDSDSCFMLGMTYGILSDFVNSEKWLQKSSQINAQSDVIFNNLGISQMKQRKYKQAISNLTKSISLNPNNTNSLNCLGNIYRDQGDITLSEKYFLKSLEVQPNNFATLNNLGNIYLGQCIFNKALKYYQKSYSINSSNFDTIYNIGCTYQSLGQHEKSLNKFNIAKKINPSSMLPYTAIANSYEKQGKNSDAIRTLTPFINKNNLTPDLVNTYSRACLNIKEYEKALNVIKIFSISYDQTTLTPIQSQEISFTLGDLHNKTKDYDKAFRHYETANKLRPFSYNKNQTENYFQKIKDTYKENMPVSSNTSDAPIFIIGMPRSGTSLIEQILASHSKVFGAGELSRINEISNRISLNSAFPEGIKNVDLSVINSESDKHIMHLKEISENSEYVIDKMPHNFIYVGLIKTLFPNSKIIHCLRNPLDVCLSIYFHNFNSNHPYSDNLKNLGHYYNQYRNLMEYWKNKYDDIYDVHYEALLEDPENQIESMLKNINLDWQDNCLEFHKNKRIVNTPSYSQVRKPLYKSSTNRWKNYSTNISELIDAIDNDFIGKM